MTKSLCSNCRNLMTGWDGGFFGEPVTCECRIHGVTKGRKSCSKFKKRVTKSDLLNKIQSLEKEQRKLEEEKVELMEDCACQYRQIQKLESENDDLRTTITKMKNILYMLEEVYVIGEYSSEIEEDMQELKKAYDGNLEDFLNYFKDG